MNDKKIDNLFKEKLAGHAKSPSPLAWEKLNSELTKKEKKVGFLWWQKAAVVFLVCISGFLIFRTEKAVDGDQVASDLVKSETETEQPDASPHQSELQGNLQVQKSVKPETETIPSDKIKPIEPRGEKKLATKAPDTERSLFLESPVYSQHVAMHREKDQEEHSDQMNAEESDDKKEHVEAKKTPPPVSIEFRSGKRKKERTMMADAEKEAAPEDPTFSFKRLVAAVKDVKAGEIGLAEIRQAKDDLFAFDTNKEDPKAKDE